MQVGDDVEEGAHFLLGEGGRGLVHDDEFRVAHERAADGDELFVGDGEVADEFVEVDLEADLGDGFAGDLAHARAVDEAASGGDFAAERDVLHDGEVGEDGEVLVDDAYTRVDGVGGCQSRKLAAPDGDRALFGGVDSGDDFDEGGFARPVFSGEAVDFSGCDVEVDVDQGSHACEGFADVSYRQHWGVHVVSFPTRGATRGHGLVHWDEAVARGWSCAVNRLEAEGVDVVLGDLDPAVAFEDLGGALREVHGFVSLDAEVDAVFDLFTVEDLGGQGCHGVAGVRGIPEGQGRHGAVLEDLGVGGGHARAAVRLCP